MNTAIKTQTEKIYGLLKFDISMSCSKETLGMAVPIIVGGREGVLELPSLPIWEAGVRDPLRMPLVSPKSAITWKQDGDSLYWGRPNSYPDGFSSVDLALMSFEVPVYEVQNAAKDICAAFSHWLELFESYVEIVGRQNLTIDTTISRKLDRLEIFRWNAEGKFEWLPKDGAGESIVLTTGKDCSLKPDSLRHVCDLSSKLKAPAIEYRIMLEAYRAFRVGDYRKAIIESAGAAEIVLTKAAMTELSRLGISFADELLKKYRMLQGRFELARLVGVPLPHRDYKTILIEPRNNVVHRAYFSDSSQASNAMVLVDELLTVFSPNVAES